MIDLIYYGKKIDKTFNQFFMRKKKQVLSVDNIKIDKSDICFIRRNPCID